MLPVTRWRFGCATLVAALAATACTRGEQATTPSTPTVSTPTDIDPKATLADARAFYATQPDMLRPKPYTRRPKGLSDLRASTCGACHAAIYAEWSVSTHARAWLDDAQFQEELAKSRKPGKDVGWTCVNCHTPLENQLEKLVVRLEDGNMGRPKYIKNPKYDRRLALDAITCAVCHVKDGVVYGPTGVRGASPHPVKKDPDLLTPAVCTQCHQARAHFVDLNLACMFDTGREHAASPQGKGGKTCQQCHMPEVVRPLVAGGAAKKTRRHWFGGSLIPKKPEYAAELAPLLDVYPDGLAARWGKVAGRLRRGAQASLTLVIENKEAGHMLPTGDPERFITVDARVESATGAVLTSTSIRLGSVYDWNPVRLIRDNRLAPKEQRELRLDFEVPSTPRVELVIEASKWRISEENLRYHKLEGRYVAGRKFIDQRRSLPVE